MSFEEIIINLPFLPLWTKIVTFIIYVAGFAFGASYVYEKIKMWNKSLIGVKLLITLIGGTLWLCIIFYTAIIKPAIKLGGILSKKW